MTPTVYDHPRNYAVVWRTGDGPTSCGRLELGDEELRLEGSGDSTDLRIRFEELAGVEIGRGAAEQINGKKSLVLERPSCERVLVTGVAMLDDVGLLGELSELVARLRAEPSVQARAAIVVPIKRGTGDEARRLVENGPPFAIADLELDKHYVFVSEGEVIFFFEGENAAPVVRALLRSPDVLKAAAQWRRILAGRPRLAEERFAWP
jgi:hypothetical protein